MGRGLNTANNMADEIRQLVDLQEKTIAEQKERITNLEDELALSNGIKVDLTEQIANLKDTEARLTGQYLKEIKSVFLLVKSNDIVQVYT